MIVFESRIASPTEFADTLVTSVAIYPDINVMSQIATSPCQWAPFFPWQRKPNRYAFNRLEGG